MKSFVQPGDVLTVVASAAVASGDLVVAGSIIGVATGSAGIGDPVEIKTSGVYDFAKTSAEAWTFGAPIYQISATKLLTTTSTSNTLVGYAVEVAANPSPTGRIRIKAT